MHLPEQRGGHAEASSEGLAQAGRRREADLAGNGLERQAFGQQRARRLTRRGRECRTGKTHD